MLRLIAEHGQWNIAAHGAHGFFGFQRHRFYNGFNVFGAVAKSLLVFQHILVIQVGKGYPRLGQFFQPYFVLIQPVAIGLLAADFLLQLFIADDAALLQIHDKHFARLQSPFLNHMGRVHGQHTAFAGHDNPVIIGNTITGRAQAVAVKRGADYFSIAEADGCRPVPWLHDGSMEFIKSFFPKIHLVITIPCFGYQHHHHMRQAAAGHGQQFNHVVEAGRVALSFHHDGQQHLHFFFGKIGRCESMLSRLQPVQVALQRIDFSIVCNIAEGLCQPPRWKCVGGKAAVHQAEGTHHSFIAQVGKIAAHLQAGELPFVHNRFVRKRSDVKADGIFPHRIADGMAGIIFQHIQFAFKLIGVFNMVGAGNEHLLHFRLHAQGRGPDAVGVYGYFPVAQYFKPQLFGRAVEDVAALFTQSYFFREKKDSHAVAAIGRQVHAEADAFIKEKFMRGLNHNAGAVAGIGFAATGAAMLHIFQHSKRIGNMLVTLAAFNAGDKTNAAGIMFKAGIVQSFVACHH